MSLRLENSRILKMCRSVLTARTLLTEISAFREGSTTVWYREMRQSRICGWDAAPGGRTFGKYVREDGSLEYEITLAKENEKGYFIGNDFC